MGHLYLKKILVGTNKLLSEKVASLILGMSVTTWQRRKLSSSFAG